MKPTEKQQTEIDELTKKIEKLHNKRNKIFETMIKPLENDINKLLEARSCVIG